MPLNLGDLFYQIGADIQKLNQAQAAVNQFGSAVVGAAENVGRFATKAELKEMAQGVNQMKHAQRGLDALKRSMGMAEAAANKLEAAEKRINRALAAGIITKREANSIMGKVRSRFQNGSRDVGEFSERMTELKKSVQIALGPLSGVASRISAFSSLLDAANVSIAVYTAGLIAAGAALVHANKQAADFEQQLAFISKTTDINGRALEMLGNQTLDMAAALGISTDELNKISQQAGQMGIQGRDNILAFTEAIAILTRTSDDLDADKAGTALARIMNVTGEPTRNIKTLASVLTALGNTSNSTEGDIVHMANEIARKTALFRVTASEALALGTAFRDVGARAESSGSAMGRVFAVLDQAVRTGGGALKEIAEISNTTSEGFRDLFEDSSVDALEAFFLGLGKAHDEGRNVVGMLEDLGIKGQETLGAITSLIAQTQVLTKALTTMRSEEVNPSAMMKEWERQVDTFNHKWETTHVLFENIAIVLGTEFLPAATAAVEALNSILDNREGIVNFLTFLITAIPSLAAVRIAAVAWGTFSGSLLTFAGVAQVATIAARGLGVAMRFLGGPLGIAILGAEALYFFSQGATAAEKAAEAAEKAILQLKTAQGEGAEAARKEAEAQLKSAEANLVAAQAKMAQYEALVNRKTPRATGQGHIFRSQLLVNQKEVESLLNTIQRLRDALEGEDDTSRKGGSSIAEEAGELGTEAQKAKDKIADLIRTYQDLQVQLVAVQEEGIAALEWEKDLAKAREILAGVSQEELVQFEQQLAEAGFSGDDLAESLATLISVSGVFDESIKETVKQLRDVDKVLKDLDSSLLNDRHELMMRVALPKDSQELKVQLALMEVRNDLIQAGVQNWEEELRAREALIRQNAALTQSIQETDEANEKFKDGVVEVRRAFGGALEDALVDFKNLGDVVNAFFEDLRRMFFRMAIIDPIGQALQAGMMGASGGGGTFLGFMGSLFGFDKGGVLTRPTLIPMANGGMGIAREAGQDEAILPLTRTSNGDLGVAALTGGGGGGPFNVIINNNSNARVGVEQRKNPSGGVDLVLTLENQLGRRVRAGQGDLFYALNETFGLQPETIIR